MRELTEEDMCEQFSLNLTLLPGTWPCYLWSCSIQRARSSCCVWPALRMTVERCIDRRLFSPAATVGSLGLRFLSSPISPPGRRGQSKYGGMGCCRLGHP